MELEMEDWYFQRLVRFKQHGFIEEVYVDDLESPTRELRIRRAEAYVLRDL